MIKAIIKDNVVYCNEEHHDYKMIDYKSEKIEGKEYTKFIVRCNVCNSEFYFYSKITMKGEEHFAFSEDQAQEIKEERGSINE